MKIAFLLLDQHDGRGGLENVLETVINFPYASNNNMCLYSLFPTRDPEFLKKFLHLFCITTLPGEKFIPSFFKKNYRRMLLKRNIKVLLNQLEKDQVDAIVSLNCTKTTIRNSYLFKSFKKRHPTIPWILWTHIPISNIMKKENIINYLSVFDSFLAISSGISNEITSLLPNAEVHLVYNPINSAPLLPRNKNNRFIFIGRMAPIKRLFELVQILSKLSGEWSLDIFGAPSDEKQELYADTIKDFIYRNDLQKKVVWHGWKDNPWNELENATALLLHSTMEGFGLVLAEANMRGIPCVASDCLAGPQILLFLISMVGFMI